MAVRKFRDDRYLLFVTANGTVKKTALSAYANPRLGGIIGINLDEGDRLLAVRETDGHALLTPRELEVLATLAEGMTNKAIARRLNISLHTVKFHVESLFRKLGARTRTEAVAKASERRRQETITL